MKTLFSLLLTVFILAVHAQSQKRVYDIILFGNKIGTTVVEKIESGNGTVQYKMFSNSEANVLFTKKTSVMNFDVVYKDGKLFSSYVKNVKDGVTEIVNIVWKETKYLISKGAETLQITSPIDFSGIQLYFTEPKGKPTVFSERLGEYCKFVKTGESRYECKVANGVNNIYTYENGVLTELEMSKGASVFMRLVR